MSIGEIQLKNIIEAALLASGQSLDIARLQSLFGEDEQPDKEALLKAIAELQADYHQRGIELKEISSGFRFQVRDTMAPWVGRLWEEKPSRYSRALMETLAVIAYRQPITRGDIEDIRGVSVSSTIIKTLQEREWIRVVGHRDLPGKPAMFATTRQFLDHFNLRNLDELPSLAEIKDIDSINVEMELGAEGHSGEGDEAGLAVVAQVEGGGDAENLVEDEERSVAALTDEDLIVDAEGKPVASLAFVIQEEALDDEIAVDETGLLSADNEDEEQPVELAADAIHEAEALDEDIVLVRADDELEEEAPLSDDDSGPEEDRSGHSH